MNLLSVIIPAKNEEDTIVQTIENLLEEFNNIIDYEILVINDHSDDNTELVLIKLSSKYHNVFYLNNKQIKGVGNAIKFGIKKSKGDIVAICMADGSDSPKDVLISYKFIISGAYDCVFGSRFIIGVKVKDYPFIKWLLNRLFNNFVMFISNSKYNDFTNIFKVYRRKVINSILPINSQGFSIGLEMSLKSFKKMYRIKVIPISWHQRKAGKSKLKIIPNIRLYFKTLITSL